MTSKAEILHRRQLISRLRLLSEADFSKQFPSKLSGSESLLQVAHRVFNLIEEIKEKYSRENVLFVTHGSVCRVINAYFNDLSNEEYHKYHTGNCEIREYIIEK